MKKEKKVFKQENKKKYSPPSLIVYGKLSELTAGGSGDAMEHSEVTFEFLQTIAWWNLDVPQVMGGIEHIEFSAGHSP